MKISQIKIVVLLVSSILMSGCRSYSLISEKDIKVKGMKLIADERVSYVIYDAEKKRTFTLSEPPPDAILERATKLANSLALQNQTTNSEVTTSQQLELANNVVQLGERTVAVNILRDALFRLSEMNVNNRNEKLEDGYKVLFDSILSVAKQIALVDIQKQISIQKKAEAETLKTKFKIRELDMNLDAKTNYQVAIKMILTKDLDGSLNAFKTLYQKYPTYFNIDEIYKKLKQLSKDKMTDADWEVLNKYIINEEKTWGIDDNLIQELSKQLN